MTFFPGPYLLLFFPPFYYKYVLYYLFIYFATGESAVFAPWGRLSSPAPLHRTTTTWCFSSNSTSTHAPQTGVAPWLHGQTFSAKGGNFNFNQIVYSDRQCSNITFCYFQGKKQLDLLPLVLAMVSAALPEVSYLPSERATTAAKLITDLLDQVVLSPDAATQVIRYVQIAFTSRI